MKITAGKREDILRRKEEYETDRNARQARHDEQYNKWDESRHAVLDPIKRDMEARLSWYPVLDFDVRVEESFGSGLEVFVYCNQNKLHSDTTALAWNYNAKIGSDGEVKRETGSWSGLQAVTPEQIESLQQSVDAIKMLNNLDWVSILKKDMPKYGDYVTEEDPRYDRDKPDFDKELLEAEIEEAIGTNTLFKGKGRRGGTVWFNIVRQTPTMYMVTEIPNFYFQNGGEDADRIMSDPGAYAVRYKKDSLLDMLVTPLETKEA